MAANAGLQLYELHFLELWVPFQFLVMEQTVLIDFSETIFHESTAQKFQSYIWVLDKFSYQILELGRKFLHFLNDMEPNIAWIDLETGILILK